MRGFVYIPIEKKNRELFSKLLVAHYLLKLGAHVVIGFYHAIFASASRMPRGVMYFKGLNRVQFEFMALMKSAGHSVAATDEEALGASDPKFMMQDCWKETVEVVDKVFCQGAVHRDALSAYRGFSTDQLTITGNPRVDLLRDPFRHVLDREAETIRREHGPFILINTDSGGVNSRAADVEAYQNLLVRVGWIDPNSPSDQMLLRDHLEHDRNNIDAVSAFISAMKKELPERRLVLRPHPDEDIEHWKGLANSHDNLMIVTNTAAPPWIIASDCLIQTGCTTGVEAALLGTPTISIVCQPDDVMHPGFRLSNAVNPVVRDVDNAVRAVRCLDLGQSDEYGACPELKRDLLAPHIEVDPDRFAYQKICHELGRLLPESRGPVVLEPLGEDVGRALQGRVTRATFSDAEFTRSELSYLLHSISQTLEQDTDFVVRDLGWSVFGLTPDS